MAVNKLTFDGGLNTAKDASSLNYMLGDKEYGILEGVESDCACSFSGSTVTFSSGVIMIYGRAIRIDNGTQISIPLNAIAYGYVILKVDLSSEAVELTYKEGPTFPTLIQNNLQKISNGVFEFPLVQYIKSTASISFIGSFKPSYLLKSSNVYQKKLSTSDGLSILNDTISINYNIVQQKLTPGTGIVINGANISLDSNKTFTKVYEGQSSGNLLELFRNDNDVFMILSNTDASPQISAVNVTNQKTIGLDIIDSQGNIKVKSYSMLTQFFQHPVIMKKINSTRLSFYTMSMFTSTDAGVSMMPYSTCDLAGNSVVSLSSSSQFRIFKIT